MPGITRLQLYNNALMVCGDSSLASLTEAREPRRLLDDVYNSNGIDYCLEQGQWWFAMRAVQIDYDPSITPDFGYQYAFTKPTDWINTSALCQDERFNVPLTRYNDERANWYADITPIYAKYISNDPTFGKDLSQWPASFAEYVATYFASRIIHKLSGDKSSQRETIFGPPGQPSKGLLAGQLHRARGAAAQTQPTQWPAQGSWSRARQGWRGNRGPFGDGGTSGSLL